jgi:hypothetical protein
MMAKVRRRSISAASGERLWPAADARTGMFMLAYVQGHALDSRQLRRRVPDAVQHRLVMHR